MLQLENVGLQMGTGPDAKTLLQDINLHVGQGESVGLVGESGSGKSMTLRSILRTLPEGGQTSGTVRFNDAEIGRFSREELRRFRASEVSMISQNPMAALNPVLRVERFLVEGIQAAQPRTSAAAARSTARGILADVGIHDPERCLRSYPHQLSGGMLQRVVIAGSVARGSSLLLADEPTTALDVTTQSDVIAILNDARRDAGMAMIFVTHDLDLAAAACERIAVMQRGRIVESGSAEQVLESPRHEYTQMLVASKPSLTHRAGYPADSSEADK